MTQHQKLKDLIFEEPLRSQKMAQRLDSTETDDASNTNQIEIAKLQNGINQINLTRKRKFIISDQALMLQVILQATSLRFNFIVS